MTEIQNSSMTITNLSGGIKEVCFPVSSFSSFYLHSKNPANAPLPVVLTHFSGEATGTGDQLTWKTLSEINNRHFNVQYSEDGIRFQTIGTMESKANNGYSADELSYAYTNQHAESGLHYYRLEQVDIDGRSTFSEIISIFRRDDNGFVNIYPNPTEGVFTIESKLPVQVRITDINGNSVFEKADCTQTSVELTHAGWYIVKLTDNDGQQHIRKLIVR